MKRLGFSFCGNGSSNICVPSAAKADSRFADIAARLKPRPFKAIAFLLKVTIVRGPT